MKPPAFQFYADDFLAGTITMSHEERGFYILLLCVQWAKGAVTDDDFTRLGRTVAEPSLNHVRTKFNRGSDGLWRNERLEIERAKQNDYRAKQAAKGRASAEQRFNRGSTVVQPKGEPEVNSPSPSPSPSTSGESNTGRRPSLEEVKVKCQMAGWPETEGEAFWHHFEASGWIDKNGHRVVAWESKLSTWVTNARAKPAEAAQQGNGTHRGNGAGTVVLGKELERVMAKMKVIRDNYGDHQSWTDSDLEKFRTLKARRNELRAKLGVVV